jgi:hypothetical protein
MPSKDLQSIDELIHVADMAVRVASQLRLWLTRRSLGDQRAIDEGIRFLDEAVRGGRFVDTGEMVAGSSSLYPLTWSADVRFGSGDQIMPTERASVRYSELIAFLDATKKTLIAISSGDQVPDEVAQAAAAFFDQLGQFLGAKADNALRSPAGGTQLLYDRFSYQ